MTADILEVLRTTSLFAGFTDEQLEGVPLVGHRHSHAPGEKIVVREADGTRSLWVVIDGEVEVVVGGETHRILGPGEYFGEMALLTDAPRSADVVARTSVTTLEFSRRHLEGLIASNPSVAIEMMAELARRLQSTTAALAEVLRTPEAAAHAARLGMEIVDREAPHLGPIEYALRKVDGGSAAG